MRWTESELERYLRQGPDGALTEKALQSAVVRLARASQYMIYHTYNSRRSPTGFPDLVLVKPPTATLPDGKVVFAELKTESGQVTLAQWHWLKALQAIAGVECYLWRPSDWQEIEKILRYNL